MILFIYCLLSIATIIFVCIKRKRFSLDSRSLQHQWLFRLAITYPIISSFYFMLWIGCSFPFRLDAEGFNTFLEINKFSLGILALAPIIGAFVVYAHRSIQTETQIQKTQQQILLAEKKNNLDMMISRINFTDERLNNLKVLGNYKIIPENNVVFSFFEIKDNKITHKPLIKHINNTVSCVIKSKETIESETKKILKLISSYNINESISEDIRDSLIDSIKLIVSRTESIDTMIYNVIKKIGFDLNDRDDTFKSYDTYHIDLFKSFDIYSIRQSLEMINLRILNCIDLFLFLLGEFFNVLSFIDDSIQIDFAKFKIEKNML
ncbi:hypothetical protein [Providencia sp. PROV223]|uniref:hypothetical protein n=1 Tax=Providencia sp. PROV223 TaxID=2949917 RepID=UPI00234B82A5|nr:hypothetical protein [Providencia sp. PROV223]